MPFVTSATDSALKSLSFPFETRDDAIVKAIKLVETGQENVAVTNVETGEVLTGEALLAAIKLLAAEGGETTPPT